MSIFGLLFLSRNKYCAKSRNHDILTIPLLFKSVWQNMKRQSLLHCPYVRTVSEQWGIKFKAKRWQKAKKSS